MFGNFRQEYSSIVCKIHEKSNKIKKHSINYSHIWYFDISVLIRYTISEALVEIKQFRHEWSSKIMKISKNVIQSKGVP